MSSIAHTPRRVRAHRGTLRWLVGAILVAGIAVVLASALAGADGDQAAPAAAPGPHHASPFHAQQGAPKQQKGAPSPCCGHRP